jgi:filamentous hemagglutinin
VRIPGADQFVIDEAKIRDYLLSPEHRVGSSKAKFFARLGFEHQDWPVLQAELARFAQEDAVLGGSTRFGQKYLVAGTIHGPAGRDAQIVVVWIILDGERFPRFVTAYPGERS